MRQLDQRVSIRYELKPLTRDEMAAYIAHRIQVAGGLSAVSFTPKALHAVHQFTGGIPRLINLVCDRALLGAFSARVNRVTHDLVERAAETLDLRPVQRPRFGWLRRGAQVQAASRPQPTSLLYR
jgi:general secretion pathway protein A